MAEFKRQSDRDKEGRPKFYETYHDLLPGKPLPNKEGPRRRRKPSRVNKQEEFMLVNIAWNHSGWTRLELNPQVGFSYDRYAFPPHEALNFDFSKKGIDTDNEVFGYFQTSRIPRRFVDGGMIFFWSNNTDDKKGYFVGVYGNVAILDEVNRWKHSGFENGEFRANIKGDKRLSCLFPCPVDDSAYKTDGKRLIGQVNFTYNFDKGKALRLLDEAKNKSCGGNSNSGAIATLTAIEEYVRNKL